MAKPGLKGQSPHPHHRAGQRRLCSKLRGNFTVGQRSRTGIVEMLGTARAEKGRHQRITEVQLILASESLAIGEDCGRVLPRC